MPSRTKKNDDGWTIEEAWDSKSAKRYTRYYFKRNRAPRLEIKSKRAQRMAGLSLIEKDLRNVIAWLTKIEELHPKEDRPKGVGSSKDRANFNLVKGLYVAALTFYGKCFVSCDGRRVRLEESDLDDKYKNAHKEVMHMRHNFAAHSGADNFEDVSIVLVLTPRPRKNLDFRIFTELTQPDFAETSGDDVKFLDLAEHVQERVKTKIAKVEESIVKNEVLAEPPGHWYSRWRKKRK